MVHGINQQPKGENFITMFKNGDDLRQDILTLQVLSIMDKIWLENDLDLKMTAYKAIGTDCEQGFLEFIGDADTLAVMQYKDSLWNTFAEDTIENFITKKVKERFKKKYPEKSDEERLKYEE